MTATPNAKAQKLASSVEELCVPLGEASFCRSIVMQDMQQLDDCVEFLVLSHKVKGDAAFSSGPPRLKYESPGKLATTGGTCGDIEKETEGIFSQSSLGDSAAVATAAHGHCTVTSKEGLSFDWLVALGCLNCGAPVELRRDLVAAAEEATTAAAAAATGGGTAALALAAEKAVLRCRRCGHHIAPLHSSDEPESLVEAMESGAYLNPGLSSRGIYMYGSRSCYNFGSVSKKAWQQRFLGAEFERQQLQHHLKIMLAAGDGGNKTTCKELCERCGHTEAFFSTFQARSADEGMTVMYECTKCHHRKVFNN
ncbi:RNA polymerase, putative [Eimeria maxima]|uniref:DNA-directed RNA polymerase I subunit RPA12 n=1 Tax=Eimeria maxima TaxID=5804 RepID=U6MCN3_EIMMA|nr:RNA polymerase, putative [Eimeria maxima]CDJ60823.1 RNA polymerase, putative [Eimeria maxima]